jgi:hypothetical protein
MYDALHDHISNVIGFLRHANALDRAAAQIRADVQALEREVRAMIQKHWSYIMLHHSLTKDGETVSWQAIRRYHVQDMEWKDIGYHFGLELINSDYEILVGRPIDAEGAHCWQQGMNQKALGICFVGNFDIDSVPDEQWAKGVTLVRSLTRLLDIPISFVIGHRDYAPKSCPGKLFDLEKFRKDVAAY